MSSGVLRNGVWEFQHVEVWKLPSHQIGSGRLVLCDTTARYRHFEMNYLDYLSSPKRKSIRVSRYVTVACTKNTSNKEQNGEFSRHTGRDSQAATTRCLVNLHGPESSKSRYWTESLLTVIFFPSTTHHSRFSKDSCSTSSHSTSLSVPLTLAWLVSMRFRISVSWAVKSSGFRLF